MSCQPRFEISPAKAHNSKTRMSETTSVRSRRDHSSSSAATQAANAAALATAAANKPLISVSEQHGQVIKALYQMQQEGQLCDVHFVMHTDTANAGGSLDCGSLDCDMAVDQNTIRIPAHRAVLAASSSYFRALFTSSMLDASSSEIEIPGIRTPQTFRLLIEFLYTGKIANPSPSEDPNVAPSAELADQILGVLELADMYAVEVLHTACIAFLRQRITVSNCLRWMYFTKQMGNCGDLYQGCLAFFCSCLKDFPVGSTDAFDVDLFISVISSDCLSVSGEMEVLELVGRWLIASPPHSDGSRIELYGARVLRFVRFALLPRPDIERWAARLSLMAPDIQTTVNSALIAQQLQPLNQDPNATQTSGVSATSSSTSGWDALTRFYSVPLYDRQKATVFKQTQDAGLVRAVVLAPDHSLLFAGSASTSSSEIIMPINPAAAAAGIAPEPCLKVWNTTTWVCEQSIPCGDDIVSLVVQEYPAEVYADMLKLYQSAIQAAASSTRSSEPPVNLPSYQLISAQLSRASHHHTPKLSIRIWEFQPSAMLSSHASNANYAASAGGRWLCTKQFALSPAFVKNPVLFVVDTQRLLVGNYRTIQIWNTFNSVIERELKLDATLRSFVLCSCGHELLGRSVRDIRAWDTRTWIATRAMAAKLGGDHRAKLASCLTMHRNRLIFPMRDCIITCDPHTGARFQKFALPPDPSVAPYSQLNVITVSPALGGGSLMSAAALSNPDAWLLSSFVLAGDLLVMATYQGWLGIFSIHYNKDKDAADPPPASDEANMFPSIAGYARDGDMVLHCERYWQTAGAGIDKGAVVNSLAVVTSTASSPLSPSAARRPPRPFDTEPCNDAAMEVSEFDVQAQVEAVVSGVVTVMDYGSMLALWRKC